MIKAIQMMETASNGDEAATILGFLKTQVDFIAGRLLAPSETKPGWRVQAFFDDVNHDLPLCDGCRRVIVPPALIRQCSL